MFVEVFLRLTHKANIMFIYIILRDVFCSGLMKKFKENEQAMAKMMSSPLT